MQLTPTQEVLVVTAVIAAATAFVYKLDRSWDYDNTNTNRSGDNSAGVAKR